MIVARIPMFSDSVRGISASDDLFDVYFFRVFTQELLNCIGVLNGTALYSVPSGSGLGEHYPLDCLCSSILVL